MATARFFSSRPEHRPHQATPRVDADALAADLRRSLRGEVRFDSGSRALARLNCNSEVSDEVTGST